MALASLTLTIPLGDDKRVCPNDCPLQHELSSYNHGYSWECGLTRERLHFDGSGKARLLRTSSCLRIVKEEPDGD